MSRSTTGRSSADQQESCDKQRIHESTKRSSLSSSSPSSSSPPSSDEASSTCNSGTELSEPQCDAVQLMRSLSRHDGKICVLTNGAQEISVYRSGGRDVNITNYFDDCERKSVVSIRSSPAKSVTSTAAKSSAIYPLPLSHVGGGEPAKSLVKLGYDFSDDVCSSNLFNRSNVTVFSANDASIQGKEAFERALFEGNDAKRCFSEVYASSSSSHHNSMADLYEMETQSASVVYNDSMARYIDPKGLRDDYETNRLNESTRIMNTRQYDEAEAVDSDEDILTSGETSWRDESDTGFCDGSAAVTDESENHCSGRLKHKQNMATSSHNKQKPVCIVNKAQFDRNRSKVCSASDYSAGDTEMNTTLYKNRIQDNGRTDRLTADRNWEESDDSLTEPINPSLRIMYNKNFSKKNDSQYDEAISVISDNSDTETLESLSNVASCRTVGTSCSDEVENYSDVKTSSWVNRESERKYGSELFNTSSNSEATHKSSASKIGVDGTVLFKGLTKSTDPQRYSPARTSDGDGTLWEELREDTQKSRNSRDEKRVSTSTTFPTSRYPVDNLYSDGMALPGKNRNKVDVAVGGSGPLDERRIGEDSWSSLDYRGRPSSFLINNMARKMPRYPDDVYGSEAGYTLNHGELSRRRSIPRDDDDDDDDADRSSEYYPSRYTRGRPHQDSEVNEKYEQMKSRKSARMQRQTNKQPAVAASQLDGNMGTKSVEELLTYILDDNTANKSSNKKSSSKQIQNLPAVPLPDVERVSGKQMKKVNKPRGKHETIDKSGEENAQQTRSCVSSKAELIVTGSLRHDVECRDVMALQSACRVDDEVERLVKQSELLVNSVNNDCNVLDKIEESRRRNAEVMKDLNQLEMMLNESQADLPVQVDLPVLAGVSAEEGLSVPTKLSKKNKLNDFPAKATAEKHRVSKQKVNKTEKQTNISDSKCETELQTEISESAGIDFDNGKGSEVQEDCEASNCRKTVETLKDESLMDNASGIVRHESVNEIENISKSVNESEQKNLDLDGSNDKLEKNSLGNKTEISTITVDLLESKSKKKDNQRNVNNLQKKTVSKQSHVSDLPELKAEVKNSQKGDKIENLINNSVCNASPEATKSPVLEETFTVVKKKKKTKISQISIGHLPVGLSRGLGSDSYSGSSSSSCTSEYNINGFSNQPSSAPLKGPVDASDKRWSRNRQTIRDNVRDRSDSRTMYSDTNKRAIKSQQVSVYDQSDSKSSVESVSTPIKSSVSSSHSNRKTIEESTLTSQPENRNKNEVESRIDLSGTSSSSLLPSSVSSSSFNVWTCSRSGSAVVKGVSSNVSTDRNVVKTSNPVESSRCTVVPVRPEWPVRPNMATEEPASLTQNKPAGSQVLEPTINESKERNLNSENIFSAEKMCPVSAEGCNEAVGAINEQVNSDNADRDLNKEVQEDFVCEQLDSNIDSNSNKNMGNFTVNSHAVFLDTRFKVLSNILPTSHSNPEFTFGFCESEDLSRTNENDRILCNCDERIKSDGQCNCQNQETKLKISEELSDNNIYDVESRNDSTDESKIVNSESTLAHSFTEVNGDSTSRRYDELSDPSYNEIQLAGANRMESNMAVPHVPGHSNYYHSGSFTNINNALSDTPNSIAYITMPQAGYPPQVGYYGHAVQPASQPYQPNSMNPIYPGMPVMMYHYPPRVDQFYSPMGPPLVLYGGQQLMMPGMTHPSMNDNVMMNSGCLISEIQDDDEDDDEDDDVDIESSRVVIVEEDSSVVSEASESLNSGNVSVDDANRKICVDKSVSAHLLEDNDEICTPGDVDNINKENTNNSNNSVALLEKAVTVESDNNSVSKAVASDNSELSVQTTRSCVVTETDTETIIHVVIGSRAEADRVETRPCEESCEVRVCNSEAGVSSAQSVMKERDGKLTVDLFMRNFIQDHSASGVGLFDVRRCQQFLYTSFLDVLSELRKADSSVVFYRDSSVR